MIESYKKFWINYTNFKDRTTVKDYWYVVLMNIIISIVLGIIINAIPSLSFVSTLYSLATLIPGLAIAVRRLHDINKSGWYYLMGLIPIAGFIILIVYFCKASVTENNNYGVQL